MYVYCDRRVCVYIPVVRQCEAVLPLTEWHISQCEYLSVRET